MAVRRCPHDQGVPIQQRAGVAARRTMASKPPMVQAKSRSQPGSRAQSAGLTRSASTGAHLKLQPSVDGIAPPMVLTSPKAALANASLAASKSTAALLPRKACPCQSYLSRQASACARQPRMHARSAGSRAARGQ